MRKCIPIAFALGLSALSSNTAVASGRSEILESILKIFGRSAEDQYVHMTSVVARNLAKTFKDCPAKSRKNIQVAEVFVKALPNPNAEEIGKLTKGNAVCELSVESEWTDIGIGWIQSEAYLKR